MVGLHSIIPGDAFSADTLGTERAGNGVLIDDGLILTIGYLITEAEAVWLLAAPSAVPGIFGGKLVSGQRTFTLVRYSIARGVWLSGTLRVAQTVPIADGVGAGRPGGGEDPVQSTPFSFEDAQLARAGGDL